MTRIPPPKSVVEASKTLKEKMRCKRKESILDAQLNGETWRPEFDGWTTEVHIGDSVLIGYGYDPKNPKETVGAATERAFDEFAARQLEPKHPYKYFQDVPWNEIFKRAGFNTLKAAANECGTSVSTISNIKNGRGNPGVVTARRIVTGLMSHAPDEKTRGFIAHYLLFPSTKMSPEKKLEVIKNEMREAICKAAAELDGHALKALYAVSASLLQAMPIEYPDAYSEIGCWLPGYTADITLDEVSDLERTVTAAKAQKALHADFSTQAD